MLTAEADSTWRTLIDNAVGAESWEDVDLAFEALKAESQWRRRQADEATSEQRSKAGAPVHARTMSSTALEEAVADVASWAGVPREPPPEADEAQE
jgi:hypothetical protein